MEVVAVVWVADGGVAGTKSPWEDWAAGIVDKRHVVPDFLASTLPGVLVLEDVAGWKGRVVTDLDGPTAVTSDLGEGLGERWVGAVQNGVGWCNGSVARDSGEVDISRAVGDNNSVTRGGRKDGCLHSGSEANDGGCDDGVHFDLSGRVDGIAWRVVYLGCSWQKVMCDGIGVERM